MMADGLEQQLNQFTPFSNCVYPKCKNFSKLQTTHTKNRNQGLNIKTEENFYRIHSIKLGSEKNKKCYTFRITDLYPKSNPVPTAQKLRFMTFLLNCTFFKNRTNVICLLSVVIILIFAQKLLIFSRKTSVLTGRNSNTCLQSNVTTL